MSSLLILPYASSEEHNIYKSVDKNGHVIYSDTPSPTSKKITVTPQNSIRMHSVEKPIKHKQIEKEITQNLIIESPVDQATIRDNQGNVIIKAATYMPINVDEHFLLFVDENIYSKQQKTPNFTVKNLPRGTHTIKIQLMNDTGKIIALSPTHTIYMHRASIQ